MLSQYGSGSVTIRMLISCLNTMFPKVKQYLVMRNTMASIKVCLVKYLFLQPSDVQQTDVFEKLMQLRVFDLKSKFITSDKTLIKRF